MKVFCRANLPNSGLGNRLFAWARCVVFARLHNIPMFEPIWLKPSLGPILRREKDLRIYSDLFIKNEKNVPLAKQLWIRALSQKIEEPKNLKAPLSHHLKNYSLYEFSEMREYFEPLNAHSEMIKKELLAITRPNILSNVEKLTDIDVALHIRRGDFFQAKTANDLQTRGGVRTPLDWFEETLQTVRQIAGRDLKVIVVSDGTKEELARLTKQPNVTILPDGPALEHMLSLSRAKLLIGSGGSSFTAWGAFLGRCHSVVIPGQDLSWFKIKIPGAFAGVHSRENPNSDFEKLVKNLFHPSPSRKTA